MGSGLAFCLFGCVYLVRQFRYWAIFQGGNMSRPLRVEFAGALYHVTSRGNARQPIYLDEQDFTLFKELVAKK